jgi:hypothetical protein
VELDLRLPGLMLIENILMKLRIKVYRCLSGQELKFGFAIS